MILRKHWLVSIGGIFSLGVASAQGNLGALLDMGAKKISKVEYVTSLPVTSYSVWPDGKGEEELTYFTDVMVIDDDRTSGGAITFPQFCSTVSGTEKQCTSGATSGATGKWTMTASGKICTSVRFTSWPGTHEECRFLFRLGDEIFVSMSDSARAAPVQKQIKR